MGSKHTYDWWHRAVAGEKMEYGEQPQCGFYRIRDRDTKLMVPVAIFPDAQDNLIAVVGFAGDQKVVDPAEQLGSAEPVPHLANLPGNLFAPTTWALCATQPVAEERYRAAIKNGHWDDVHPTLGESAPAAPNWRAEGAPPPMGDNAPPDEAAAMRDQIATVKIGISDYDRIEDDTMAARAQSLRSRLLELSREAKKKHDAIKAPHLEACQAIDKTWMPLVKEAKDAADKIRAALEDYESEKLQAAAAAREAEAAAQAKAAEAAAAGAPTPVPPPPPPPPEPATIKGGYGRAATVKPKLTVTGVSDWDALWNFMREHPEVKELLTTLAQRAIDKGLEVPGVITAERARVA